VADFLTLGNHAFDAEGYEEFLGEEYRVVRPANFGEKDPGLGLGVFEAGGVIVGVINVLGRVFVERTRVSPFEAADLAVEELKARGAELLLVDSHAEATSEKQALGHYLDGKAHAVLGTHTHVPTADHSILPGGTAYVSDVGMTGCKESIIGFEREDFLALFMGDWRGISVATRSAGQRDRSRKQGVETLAAGPFTMAATTISGVEHGTAGHQGIEGGRDLARGVAHARA
jgi:metallophosphoesterase (TIGR00282 family)